jgi:hypothetical protein
MRCRSLARQELFPTFPLHLVSRASRCIFSSPTCVHLSRLFLNRAVLAQLSPCPFSFPDFLPSFILMHSRFCLCRLVFCLTCMHRLPHVSFCPSASALLSVPPHHCVVCMVYLTCLVCCPSVLSVSSTLRVSVAVLSCPVLIFHFVPPLLIHEFWGKPANSTITTTNKQLER